MNTPLFKVHPSALRDAIPRFYRLREAADYTWDMASEVQAAWALQCTRTFVQATRNERDEKKKYR